MMGELQNIAHLSNKEGKMKKTYLMFIIPIVLLILISTSQLMSPFGPLEIVAVVIGSIITGSLIGLVLYLVNKYWFKKMV
jgi:uncharacterized integral membrane protein